MQTSATLVGIFAAFAMAQAPPFPSGFPECGVTCITNMVGLASNLGCDSSDASCLCTKPDFLYGVRDCATEACTDNAAAIIQFGSDWCAQNGVVVGGFPSASSTGTAPPSTTVEATGSPISGSQSGGGATSEIVSTITNSDGSVATTTIGTTTGEGSASAPGSGAVIPIATTELVSTLTNSDGSVATTTFATSTVFSTSGGGSGTESGSASETGSGSASTTITSESTYTSGDVTGTTSFTTTEPVNEPTTTGGEGGSQTTESPGVAAQQTAAPAGLVAAAGLAFLML